LKRKLPEEVKATPEQLKAVLCFSSVYYNVTDTNETRTFSTAQSSTTVLAANGQSIDVNIHLDTCGSRNLASEHLLHNIKKAEEYGHDQIYMVTVNGNSPSYNRMGELHFTDEDKNPIITLCYVQNQPIKGIENFVLISNNTLVAIQTDLNYHSSMCAHVGIVPLRRLVSQPYHYSDKIKHVWFNNNDVIIPIKQSDQVTDKQSSPVSDGNKTMLAVDKRNRERKVSIHQTHANVLANPGWQNNFLKLTS
jgi:hypothetical protein